MGGPFSDSAPQRGELAVPKQHMLPAAVAAKRMGLTATAQMDIFMKETPAMADAAIENAKKEKERKQRSKEKKEKKKAAEAAERLQQKQQSKKRPPKAREGGGGPKRQRVLKSAQASALQDMLAAGQ